MATAPHRTRYDYSPADLAELLAGEPPYRVEQVWRGLYGQGADPHAISTLPRALRDLLADRMPAALTPLTEQSADGGETVKWLWGLAGGGQVETVLMHYRDRVTACVSSQAGCGMHCVFCATGQAGLLRNLTTGEIVEQVIRARQRAGGWRKGGAEPARLGNIVFMGMGEPMANYQNVWRAIERIHGDVGISARRITVSTVGLVPGIHKLAAEALPVNLAVSLHAANDTLRSSLVPPNRRYPLAVLLAACQEYVERTGRRLSFEWALIDGVNDRPSDATELATAALGLPLAAHVNLIPLNPTPGYLTRGTPAAGVQAFRDRLVSLGVNATVRDTRGQSIDAACGQLAARTPALADVASS